MDAIADAHASILLSHDVKRLMPVTLPESDDARLTISEITLSKSSSVLTDGYPNAEYKSHLTYGIMSNHCAYPYPGKYFRLFRIFYYSRLENGFWKGNPDNVH